MRTLFKVNSNDQTVNQCVSVLVGRCIVDALQQACHLYDESLAKLTVLTDATNQKISLTKHLAKECNIEVISFTFMDLSKVVFYHNIR